MITDVTSWKRIRKEIKKCEVVCSNCHQRRTGKRIKSFRYCLANGLPKKFKYKETTSWWHRKSIQECRWRLRVKNHEFVFLYLQSHPCVDCKEHDVMVLEFDHLKNKVASVSELLENYSIERIMKEIKKCEVVCSNCHQRRTSARIGGTHVQKLLPQVLQ
jgi:hypothetical protein